jgi:DNA polymerase-3 subunit epsilon
MDFLDRPIAITDIETTGLDASTHEIIELAVVLVNQRTLEILNTFETKVIFEHPELFGDKAKEVNGYEEEDWVDAIPLVDAMDSYNEVVREAVFCSQVITFDWPFIAAAYKKTGVPSDIDYHRLDIPSMTWIKLRKLGIEKLGLDAVSEFLKIAPEVKPHRAINGAMQAYKVLKILYNDF